MGWFSKIFTPTAVLDALTPDAASTPTPAQAQFETQINELAGTKVERVKQPDGTWALVQSKLPLSAEDQAYEDQLKGIAQSSLDFLTKLANNYSADDIPWLKDFLSDYEKAQTGMIERSGILRAASEEKTLARYGQGDSTAATEARAQRGATTQNKYVELGRSMSGIEQDARNSEISKQASLYATATGALDSAKATQLGSLASLVSAGQAAQNSTQNYNNTVAGVIGQNNSNALAAQQAGYSNAVGLAGLITAPMTGGASLALPGLYGGLQSSGFAKWGTA